MTYIILWGRTPDLTNELNPPTEQSAWARYRELITTHYAALIIDTEAVAHNLTQGPVISAKGEG